MARLLFVIKNLALHGGGAERVLMQVAGGLTQRGHQVTIASFEQTGAQDFYPCDPAIRRIRFGLLDSERAMPLSLVGTATRRLRTLLQDLRPDLAIGFMYGAYLPLGLAGLGLCPVIASEHASHSFYPDRLRRLGLYAGLRLGTCATIPSQTARNGYPPWLGRRMIVQANPVTLQPAVRDLVAGGRKRLLTVGRLREDKNHGLLLRAFAVIAERFPEWELRLVGDGACQGELTALSRALGIDGQVTFVGPVRAVATEFANADLFVLPSLLESFAIAAAEAMQARLAIVGLADCLALREIVTDNVNGVLVPPGDHVAGLAAALARLMTDPAERRRLGENGPAAVARFTVEAVTDRWEAMIGDVLARRTRTPDRPR